MTDTKKAAKRAGTATKASAAFSDEEREAMKERAAEMKSARGKGARADGEGDVLAKIAAMPAPDRRLAERIHAIVKANAPELSAKTWYGMPAYANKDGKVVCFFQDAAKFKSRYATLGFSDQARLDSGNMWPSAFALTELSEADEKAIAALVKRAAS